MVFQSQLDYIYDYCCSIQNCAEGRLTVFGGTYKSTLYLILTSRVILLFSKHLRDSSDESVIYSWHFISSVDNKKRYYEKCVCTFHILKVNGAQCYFWMPSGFII